MRTKVVRRFDRSRRITLYRVRKYSENTRECDRLMSGFESHKHAMDAEPGPHGPHAHVRKHSPSGEPPQARHPTNSDIILVLLLVAGLLPRRRHRLDLRDPRIEQRPLLSH